MNSKYLSEQNNRNSKPSDYATLKLVYYGWNCGLLSATLVLVPAARGQICSGNPLIPTTVTHFPEYNTE